MPAPADQSLDERSLPGYLHALGLIGRGARVVVEPAGDGNINWVRRARDVESGASWIVKQARPALERFPQYRASTERIVFEERWLRIASEVDVRGVCPRVVRFDEARRVLVLEDLGDAERLDRALARGAAVDDALCAVAGLLGAVHRSTRDPALADRFRNDEMRRLHGDHIFALPLEPNDFPLEPPLRARAERLWRDAELREIAARAYERYRAPRGALVHADVQAGNVLLAPPAAKLLDAEIAHVGDPAFDVGVLLAHLLLPGLARRDLRRAGELAAGTWQAYAAAAGDAVPPFADVARYAGIEALRRTIGAARVEAVRDGGTALAALDLAVALVRRPPESSAALESELARFAA